MDIKLFLASHAFEFTPHLRRVRWRLQQQSNP